MKATGKKQKTNSIGQITAKKQKYVGSKYMVDPDTGEAVPMQIVEIEDRDFNFHKVWLQNLITSLEGISNQKLKLAFWIIDHLDKENKLVMTQRAIAEGSKMSLATVVRTMKALQQGDPAFLQRINSGAYRVNPDVIWKGSYNSRLGVIFDYADKQRGDKTKAKEAEEPTEARKPVDAARWEAKAARDAKYLREMKELNPDMTDEALKDFAENHGMERGYAAMAAEAPQTPVEAPEAAGGTEEPLPGQMALEAVQEAVAV